MMLRLVLMRKKEEVNLMLTSDAPTWPTAFTWRTGRRIQIFYNLLAITEKRTRPAAPPGGDF